MISVYLSAALFVVVFNLLMLSMSLDYRARMKSCWEGEHKERMRFYYVVTAVATLLMDVAIAVFLWRVTR